ncbi:MAG: tetratricopeptide repeat protein [Spirochaetales bacterium]|nr:tetratricopeptide repeat protein [Spirochaetales bacterium]
MKTALALCLLLLAASLPLAAQELLVEYLEGALELKQGSRWTEVYIGESLPPQSVIRLEAGGFAELSAGSVTITLNQGGTYNTDTLFKSGQKVAAWNLGGVVNSKLSKLISPTSGTETATMGVRGDRMDSGELTWVEEGTEYLEEGKRLLAAGQVDEGIRRLEQGAEWAITDDERHEHLFYAAYGHSLKGESVVSLIMLEDMRVGPAARFFTDYVLLKGKLLIDSLAFEDALALFDQYLQHPDMGETTQVVHYLSAVCYQGLDKGQQARRSLEAAHKIDPNSEYGRSAQQMMGSL